LPPNEFESVIRANSDLRDKTYLFSHDVAPIPGNFATILDAVRSEQNAPPLDVLRTSLSVTNQGPKAAMPSATRYVNPMLQGQTGAFAHHAPMPAIYHEERSINQHSCPTCPQDDRLGITVIRTSTMSVSIAGRRDRRQFVGAPEETRKPWPPRG